MKKIIFTVVAIFSAILFLCACSLSKNGKPVGFVQLANENKERIWFNLFDSNLDGELSKDDRIVGIFVTKNGKMDYYNITPSKELSLSTFNNKSDKEIIDIAKKEDKKYFKMKASVEMTDFSVIGEEKENIDEQEESEKREEYQKKVSNIKKMKYEDFRKIFDNYQIEAKVKTDSSGDNVIKESLSMLDEIINIKHSDDDSSDVFFKQEIYTNPIISTIQTDMNKTKYKGFYVKEGSFLVTGFYVSKSLPNYFKLGFDDLNTKNVDEVVDLE